MAFSGEIQNKGTPLGWSCAGSANIQQSREPARSSTPWFSFQVFSSWASSNRSGVPAASRQRASTCFKHSTHAAQQSLWKKSKGKAQNAHQNLHWRAAKSVFVAPVWDAPTGQWAHGKLSPSAELPCCIYWVAKCKVFWGYMGCGHASFCFQINRALLGQYHADKVPSRTASSFNYVSCCI